MRHLAMALLLALFAACSGSSDPPPMSANARLVGGQTSEIEVLVADVPPGTEVEEILLLGPDGSVTPARRRETTRSVEPPGYYGPSGGLGVGVGGGSRGGFGTGVGVGIGFPLFGSDRRAERVFVTASIVVPDPALYRADPGAWSIEVRTRDAAGNEQLMTLPAPHPS